MQPLKPLAFTAACLFTIAGILAVGCSDDDKPTAPALQWKWAELGDAMPHTALALTVYNNKLIAAGAQISPWDGSSWASLATYTNGWVNTLTVYDNKLIAGGLFSTAGGINANYIAAWGLR
jgi:hypothetical protein